MGKIKVLFVLVLLVIVGAMLTGCLGNTSQEQERAYTEEVMQHLFDVQPPPKFTWSLERDIFIQLYQKRNEALATYTVISSQFGEVLFECTSIGYPLAADYQLTNPSQKVYGYDITVEQAEPNGLYSSKNTAGTWVLCVNDDGSVYAVYTELNANTWPMPVVQKGEGLQRVPAEGAKPSSTIDLKGP